VVIEQLPTTLPTARYAGSCSCSPGVGRMWELGDAERAALYPGNEELLERFTSAVTATVDAGFLLAADVQRVMASPF